MRLEKFRIITALIVLFLFTVLTNVVLATPIPDTPIPDTGQTKCYDNQQEIPCPQPGYPFYGQDAQYGPNLQSFTDLGNGIVRDNVTGLEWQQASAPSTFSWPLALDYVAGMNSGSGSYGFTDWRLPTKRAVNPCG